MKRKTAVSYLLTVTAVFMAKGCVVLMYCIYVINFSWRLYVR